MECLSQGDSSANSSDPDDELGPAYINESGLGRILGRMTGKPEIDRIREGLPTTRELLVSAVAFLVGSTVRDLRKDARCGFSFQ